MKLYLMNVPGTERLHCSVDLGVRFHRLVPDESDRGVSIGRLHNPACVLTEHPTTENRL